MRRFYIAAFWDLSTCRSFGMGIGPIPWRDIVAYARQARLAEDVASVFVYVIRQLDAEYLSWHREQMKAAEPKIGNRTVTQG